MRNSPGRAGCPAELLADRKRSPRDDLMSGIAGTRDLEAMSDYELRATVVNLIQFLLAGHETTTSQRR